MPAFVNKSFGVTANANRRYEITGPKGGKIATYNPLTQLIHFTTNGNPAFSVDQLKEMPFEDRKMLNLSEEAVQTIYGLIKDLPLLANKPRLDESQNSYTVERSSTKEEVIPRSIPAIELQDTVGKNIERQLFFESSKSPKLINDTYTSPEICNTYNNIKGKNNLFIRFKYKINGKLKPFKIPGNEINLIKDLELRIKKMNEYCIEIALKLASGWNPDENKM